MRRSTCAACDLPIDYQADRFVTLGTGEDLHLTCYEKAESRPKHEVSDGSQGAGEAAPAPRTCPPPDQKSIDF